jgi:hypothetical protein
MAPKKAIPNSEVAAKQAGLTPMTALFKPNKKPGRQAQRARRRTEIMSQTSEVPTVAVAATSEPAKKNIAISRRIWSKGEGLVCMTEAVASWEEKAGE